MTQACVVYTRFSPRRNAEESASCDTQEAQCRELAATRQWDVRSAHRDEGVSGDEVDRPGLEAAIGELRKGDALVVYRRCRLARSVLLSELIQRQVRAQGARIVAVEGDVAGEEDSPETVFIRQVFAAHAELERKLIGVRTSKAMRTQQRSGKRVGRYPPYGFCFDPKDPDTLLPDKREQKGIELIRALAKEGLTAWQAARRMTLEHPKLARGEKWSPTTVAKILERKIL